MSSVFPQPPRAPSTEASGVKKELKDHEWRIETSNETTEKFLVDYLAANFPEMSRQKIGFCYNGESRDRMVFEVPFEVVTLLKKRDPKSETFTAFHRERSSLPWAIYKLGMKSAPRHLRSPYQIVKRRNF